MGKRSGFYWARLYSGPYLLIVIRYHKIYKDCKGSNNTVLALLHHFQGSIISLFASWIFSFHFHLALQIWSPISTLSHKHEKKWKKVLGERDFSILEITKTIKDFETSSMNIFKKTTENDGSDLLLIDPYRKTTTGKRTQILHDILTLLALNFWIFLAKILLCCLCNTKCPKVWT